MLLKKYPLHVNYRDYIINKNASAHIHMFMILIGQTSKGSLLPTYIFFLSFSIAFQCNIRLCSYDWITTCNMYLLSAHQELSFGEQKVNCWSFVIWLWICEDLRLLLFPFHTKFIISPMAETPRHGDIVADT